MLSRPKPWCTAPPLRRLATPLALCAMLSLLLSADAHAKSLTFEERVEAQRAIEQVYWSHRTWPKDNPGPKPDLSAVMPDAAIRARVEDYLKKSNALEKWWQRPITAVELQAELDRMASETRSPQVLRELFEALGNDPALIAETLARQILADARVRSAYSNDERFHGELRRRAEAALAACTSVECMKAMGGEYRETTWKLAAGSRVAPPGGPDGEGSLDAGEWREHLARLTRAIGSTGGSPTVRRMGRVEESDDALSVSAVLSQGAGEITTATVQWPKAPFDRWWATEAGALPIDVDELTAAFALRSVAGAACVNNTWTEISDLPSLAARARACAVWTGTEMILWGGATIGGARHNTGGLYYPSTNSWTATSTGPNVPAARSGHRGVWTGVELIVWGGYVGSLTVYSATGTGGRFSPTTNSWGAPTSTGPNGSFYPTAVWTGTEMIVWGGLNGDQTGGVSVRTGGRYDPSTDTWIATSLGANVPLDRYSHTAVWTGNRMIVWGGYSYSTGSGEGTGGRYDPSTDTWQGTSTGDNCPGGRYGQVAEWTGTEMIVWGGNSFETVNNGGRYNPSTNSWTPTSTGANVPSIRAYATSVWTGTEMIVWGGVSGPFTDLSTGGRYDPSTNSWTATATDAGTPLGGADRSAVWTGTEMIVWGGYTGGRYCACPSGVIGYFDEDGDGYGDPFAPTSIPSCDGSLPPGYAANQTDCNDSDPNIHPGAEEICNGIDDDCDGQIDENATAEVCNSMDDDCDGQIDEGLPIVYRDADQDGYGNLLLPSCYLLPGFVPNSSDCDDSDPNIHPGAAEICNNIDDDCDGQIDEGVIIVYRDADQDGYGNPSLPSCYLLPGFVPNSSDCDDSNPNIHPGAVEVCNGYDDDCNGLVDDAAGAPTAYYDWDGDGYGDPATAHPRCTLGEAEVTIAGDCNDNDFEIRPGVPDGTCNGIDDNCSGLVDEGVYPACQCAKRGQDLKGWWPGEGTAVDLNLANNGTLMGAMAFGAGKVGQAFVFDGASWVELPDGPALENVWVTLEAWIRPDSPAAFSGLGRIMSKFGTAGNRAYQFGLEPAGALRGEVSGDGTTSVVLVSPPGLLSVGTWAHVAMTFTYGTLKLFIDGNEVCSATPSFTSLFTGGSSLPNIGRDPDGGNYFVGLIDEATITGRALQDGEIKAIYNAGVNGMCTCIDNDGDGYGRDGGVPCPNGTLRDCNDSNSQIYPGRGEVCNGYDDDCDIQIDEGLTCFNDALANLTGVFDSSVAWGDYDSDGDLDILLTGQSSTALISKVYRNNGGANPTFTDIFAALTGVRGSSAAWGDYDNDGDLDIALAGTDVTNAAIAKIYQNNGGTFSAIPAGLTGVKAPSLAWGDFDNDGDLDLLVTGSTNGSASGALTRMYRNQGFGNFTAFATALPAVYQSSVACADYDNDGDLDVLIAGIDATSTLIARIYRSNGAANPVFALAAGLTPFWAGSAAWGDFDNDGDLDPLVTGGVVSGNRISIVYRNAPPIFYDSSVNLTGVQYGSAVWGDCNNDGKIDIFLSGSTNFGNDRVSRIYRNDVVGMGAAFTNLGAPLPNLDVQSSSAAWGDYDNDGDLDLLLTGTTNAQLSGALSKVIRNLHRGTANAPPTAPTGLTASVVNGTTVTFSWNASSDALTPAAALSYNLRIGSTPGGSQTLSPMSNAANGYRRIPALGNAGERLSRTVTLPWIATYFWSVQAVDGLFAGSPFAPEQVLPLGVTGVDDLNASSLQFALGASTPNPFAHATTVAYDLPRAEQVTLEVFDVNGRRVRTLVSEFVQAGRHRAVWDGTDEHGQRAPAGVYLYRVLAGSWRATRRTVLMP